MKIQEFNKNLFDLTGKVSIVTGCATGMGQAFAYALASCGSDIVAVYHNNLPNETIKLVESLNKKILPIKADIRQKDDRENLIQKTLQEFSKIDVLVNNAGVIKRQPVLEHSDQYWQQVIDTNLNSIFYLSRDVANVMVKNQKGKIINIASMLSYQGGKFVPGYTASKHAVAGLTKSFCNELACKNIQVNAVAPGYVITNNTKPILEDPQREKSISARIPKGQWAKPIDIAGAIVFLASEASNYINGTTIAVDGGWLAS